MEVAHDQFMAPVVHRRWRSARGIEETTVGAARHDLARREQGQGGASTAPSRSTTSAPATATPSAPRTSSRGRAGEGGRRAAQQPLGAGHDRGRRHHACASPSTARCSMLRGAKVLEPEVDAGSPVRIRLTLQPYQGKVETRDIEVKLPGRAGRARRRHRSRPRLRGRPPAPHARQRGRADGQPAERHLRPGEHRRHLPAQGRRGRRTTARSSRASRPARSTRSARRRRPTRPRSSPPQVHTAIPIKRFIVGHDSVHVTVRPVLALSAPTQPPLPSHAKPSDPSTPRSPR